MAVEFLDKLGLQAFWTKCKNKFVAKDSSGNVAVTGKVTATGVDITGEVKASAGVTSQGNVEVKEGSYVRLYNEDDTKQSTIGCNDNGKLVGNGGVLATVTDVNTAVLGLATEDFVNTAVANAPHLKREKVTTLPNVSLAKENVIYMLAISSATGDDIFDEYMLIDGRLEKMGSSRIDLSGYPTTEQMNTAIFNAHTRITEDEIDALT